MNTLATVLLGSIMQFISLKQGCQPLPGAGTCIRYSIRFLTIKNVESINQPDYYITVTILQHSSQSSPGNQKLIKKSSEPRIEAAKSGNLCRYISHSTNHQVQNLPTCRSAWYQMNELLCRLSVSCSHLFNNATRRHNSLAKVL